MDRIMGGMRFVRDDRPYAYDVRVHDLGAGQVEALATPRFGWTEAAPIACTDQAKRDLEMCQAGFMWRDGGWVPYEPSEADQADRDLVNRERATRRARTKVRRLAKFKRLTTLLTLTYRENMLDRARMQHDFDNFMKRVRRVCPDFEYICVFERQKRGAWHAHIATRRILPVLAVGGQLVKSYDLLRSAWRGVVGQENGNVDVSRRKRLSRSPAKLASYLAKYIGKTFDQAERYVNSYSASGRSIPEAVLVRIDDGDQALAISALWELLGIELSGEVDVHHALMSAGGYFLSISPAPGT